MMQLAPYQMAAIVALVRGFSSTHPLPPVDLLRAELGRVAAQLQDEDDLQGLLAAARALRR